MKKVILVLAVAAVFAFSGTVMASPPVCPPFEGFLIETETCKCYWKHVRGREF